MISRFLLTGVGVLATVAASLAATYTWTDATGDHDLSNTNNWNPIPPTANGQFYNSWVIDDSAPARSEDAHVMPGLLHQPRLLRQHAFHAADDGRGRIVKQGDVGHGHLVKEMVSV